MARCMTGGCTGITTWNAQGVNGGGGWESNPPFVSQRITGFEDQGSHQTTLTSVYFILSPLWRSSFYLIQIPEFFLIPAVYKNIRHLCQGFKGCPQVFQLFRENSTQVQYQVIIGNPPDDGRLVFAQQPGNLIR